MLPSPRTSDTNGAGHHGDGGMDLRTAVAEIPLLPTVEVQRMLLPTPSVADSTGGHERRGGERGEELLLKGIVRAVAEGALLPTPNAGDSKQGFITREQHDERAAAKKSANPNLGGLHEDLPLVVSNLLPTPTAQDSAQSGGGYNGQTNVTLTDATVRQPDRWGEYGPAIRRWEALTRPAPEPTKLNAKGNPKLSDEFDEWHMGLPAGWITDVPGVTWNEALKACGNGVVPQQGSAAIRWLLRMGQVAA